MVDKLSPSTQLFKYMNLRRYAAKLKREAAEHEMEAANTKKALEQSHPKLFLPIEDMPLPVSVKTILLTRYVWVYEAASLSKYALPEGIGSKTYEAIQAALISMGLEEFTGA